MVPPLDIRAALQRDGLGSGSAILPAPLPTPDPAELLAPLVTAATAYDEVRSQTEANGLDFIA